MQHLEQLYRKFLLRECTAEEIQYLMEHFHLKGKETELKEMISAQLESEAFSAEDSPEVRHVLDNNRKLIHEKINEDASVNVYTWRIYLKVAAVLAFIAASLWYFVAVDRKDIHSSAHVLASGDIGPGANKARLILSTGETIDLEHADSGLVVNRNGASYAKILDGKLTCLLQTAGKIDTAYNTITTPKGGTYQLVTPDGSKIWLNASSELKFPTSFGANNRVVELKGEAYFEIAKDKNRPFIVKSAQQETKVLGTHFNINSYPEELSTTTTLFEGAVQVHSPVVAKAIVLAPGEESILKNRNLVVQKAGEAAMPDWVNGEIDFNNENLKSIMRKVSRWYGVDIDLKGDVGELKFWGSVSRNNNLSAILNYLKETEDLDYRIKGSQVTIYRKETANK